MKIALIALVVATLAFMATAKPIKGKCFFFKYKVNYRTTMKKILSDKLFFNSSNILFFMSEYNFYEYCFVPKSIENVMFGFYSTKFKILHFCFC